MHIEKRFILYAIFFALFLVSPGFCQTPTPPATPTPDPTPPATPTPQEIQQSQLKTQGQDPSPSQMQAITEIAKMSMEGYRDNFNRMQWTISIAGGVIAIIIGIAAFFGISEFSKIINHWESTNTRLTNKLQNEIDQEKNNLQNQIKQLVDLNAGMIKTEAEIKSRMQNVEEEFRNNITALIKIVSIWSYLTSPERNTIRVAEQTSRQVIEIIKPKDPSILGWAYTTLGYSLRKLNRIDEALEAVEKSVEIDGSRSRAWFNAACYAALVGKKDKCLSYLREALALEPQLLENARTDKDFTSVRDDSNFQALIQ